MSQSDSEDGCHIPCSDISSWDISNTFSEDLSQSASNEPTESGLSGEKKFISHLFLKTSLPFLIVVLELMQTHFVSQDLQMSQHCSSKGKIVGYGGPDIYI